jgi:pentatricopeptide repeat protein
MVEEGEVDLAAWSALVAGYVRNGRVEEALGVLYGMLEQHGQVPPVSLLGQVGRALEQDGRLVQPGALRPLFTDTFADIRRQVFRVARHRRLDRDAAFRHLGFNRFLYFHLTLLARRRRHRDGAGGPPSSPAAAARAPPPSFLPSLLSRIGIAGSGRGSSTATAGGGGGVERRQERLDAQRTQLILGRMEDEDVYVSVPLRRLMASFTSSSSPLGGPEGRPSLF